jgi:hypothetical protein
LIPARGAFCKGADKTCSGSKDREVHHGEEGKKEDGEKEGDEKEGRSGAQEENDESQASGSEESGKEGSAETQSAGGKARSDGGSGARSGTRSCPVLAAADGLRFRQRQRQLDVSRIWRDAAFGSETMRRAPASNAAACIASAWPDQ